MAADKADAPPAPVEEPHKPEEQSEQTAIAGELICLPVKGKQLDDEVGPIVMGNMPVLQVLDLLRDFSGRVILPGEGLPTAKVNFNSGGKLKRRDAIFALENLLALNGVTLRLLDNGFVRAIASSDPERSAPPIIEVIPEDAASEQIYSKTFQLEYFDSGTAYYRVRGLLSSDDRSNIQNLPEANALLVTDSLVNLQRLEKVLDFLDQPPQTRMELYTFPVKFGSAWSIRSNILQFFRSELNNRLRQSLVYVDSRTNKLMVVTHPSNYGFFEKLVEELDQEVAPFTTTEVIQIKEGNYWSIWSVIQGIIEHQQYQFERRGFQNEQERNVANETAGRVTTSGEREIIAEGGEGGEGELAAINPALQAEPGADPNAIMVEGAAPEMQFSPYIGIYSDPSNHAYVVYGTPSDIKHIRSLVEKLDIKSAPYVTSEVMEIKHGLASDIRNVIEYSIRVQQRNFARAGLQSGAPRAQSEQALQPGQQGFEYSPFINTIADNRNNTILVQGTQQDISQVADLVGKLDVPSAPLTANEVVYLKHAQAETLARVIQNIINYQRWIFANERTTSQSEGNAETLSSPEIGFEFSNYAVVNADRRINALFVYGTRQDINRIKSIIEETDIPVEPITTTRVFPLTHTDASQTASIINQVISGQRRALDEVRSESRQVNNPASGQGDSPAQRPTGMVEGNEALQFTNFVSITPDRRSNSLIVYGTPMDIRQVESLIKEIDIEVAPLTNSKVFLLKSTQARSLYGVLNSIVRGQEQAMRQVRSSIREIRNLRPDDPNANLAETTLEALQFSPYVTITPNDRNNSIIVYGTQSDIEQLERIIEISDIEIAPRTQSRTFFIRHADADDIAATITNLIRQQQRVRERERTLTRIFRRSDNAEDAGGEADGAIGMGQETFADGGSSNTASEVISESSSASYNDLFSFDEDLEFSPYVSLVADDRSNAVLAYGTEFDLDQIARLIEAIDGVLPQVRIEVVIAEVLLTGNQVSGLDSFGISYNVTAPSQTTGSTTAPSLPGTTNPSFSSTFSLNDFSLETIFRVAKQDQFVKVLSAPSVTTTHNRQATINVGEARPIITSSASSINNPDLVTRSTVEYRDIGITLRVRPLVSSSKGFIQMDLEQIVENVIDTQLIDRNEQPIISTRRATSFVSVRDQEVIVMGGLQQVDTRDRDGSVFILGDLPIFGPLFQPKSNEQVVRELIIFIKPYIVEGFDESELLTEEELERTAIGQDIDYFLEKGRFAEQEQLVPPAPTARAAEKDLAEAQGQSGEPSRAEAITRENAEAAARSESLIDAQQAVNAPAPPEPDEERQPIPKGPRR